MFVLYGLLSWNTELTKVRDLWDLGIYGYVYLESRTPTFDLFQMKMRESVMFILILGAIENQCRIRFRILVGLVLVGSIGLRLLPVFPGMG